MKKKIWNIAFVIIGIGAIIKGITVLSGDPVQKDLLNYVNEHLLSLTKTEGKILDSYSSVTGNNYKDDKTLYNELHDTIIPQYSAFIDTLKSIKPKTPEVQTLHKKYISGAEIQISGFQLILHSIEKEDTNGIAQANGKLDSAKVIFDSFNTSLDSLAAKHDVELFKKDKK
jgi:hypothetical protein